MPTGISYEIDDRDHLLFFNEQWVYFARANHATYLADANILYRSLWNFIINQETRLIYKMMFTKIRQSSESMAFSYRCDTPTQRRFMQMRLYPRYNKHIRLTSQVLQVEDRTYMPLLDPLTERSVDFLTICSWCKRIKLPIEAGCEAWSEVEEAVEALSLFNTPVLPQLTYSICPDCQQAYLLEVDPVRARG